MTERDDATTDPSARSWVPAGDPDFTIQNLPYGAIVRPGETTAHLAVAIGDLALDLHVLAEAGIFDRVDADARALLGASSLDAVLAREPATWRAVRAAIFDYLHTDGYASRDGALASRVLVARDTVRNVRPFTVGAYVDFYASLEHATALGRILRPGDDAPLAPNWRWLPVGYHGRASTVTCEPIVRRPSGQIAGPDDIPHYAPTQRLDYELELGFVTGVSSRAPLATADARARAFGVALLCDWSARDVQAWEYRPLGPFLSKSFATTLSPWIVTLDALEPYRCAAPRQEPPPLAHLRETGDGALDINLDVSLRSLEMRERGDAALVVGRANARALYWTIAQQLAHVTSNGTRLRAGDLYGTGTISNDGPDGCGSLIERTWNGARPLALADGTTRAFLADGDEVTMRGAAERVGRARVGFGELRVTVAR